MNAVRLFWTAAGLLSLAAGIVGIAVPLMPTTPFVILSALCFANGSPRLHRWLLDHPRFGLAIGHWNRHRAIAPGAKRLALGAMGVAVALSLAAGLSWQILAIQGAVLAAAGAFILSRPSPPVD